jgi:hypothetical protein
MEEFVRYMSQIVAEDDRKERTKSYLRCVLVAAKAKRQRDERGSITMKQQIVEHVERINPGWYRKLAVAGSVAVIAAVSIAGYLFYMTPANYVSLDINPGVELTLNSMDRVIGVEATNEDGKTIMEGEKIRNRSVEKAISALVQNAYEQGYVNQDGSTVIAVLAESDDEEKALQLQEKTSEGVALAMQAKNAYSAVYATTSDLAFRNEAKEMGLSPGKYRLVKMLQALDPEIASEQYRNAKVSDIVQKANEMVLAGNTFGNLDEATREMVRKAQQACEDSVECQVRAADRIRQQEQNQDGESSGSQIQEQEQNRISGEQVSQNQEQNQNGESSGPQNQEQNQEQNQNGEPSGEQNQEQEQNRNQSGGAVISQNQSGITSQQTSDPGQYSGSCSSQSCSSSSQGSSSGSAQSGGGSSQGGTSGGSGKG